jgi:hypothetical protein
MCVFLVLCALVVPCVRLLCYVRVSCAICVFAAAMCACLVLYARLLLLCARLCLWFSLAHSHSCPQLCFSFFRGKIARILLIKSPLIYCCLPAGDALALRPNPKVLHITRADICSPTEFPGIASVTSLNICDFNSEAQLAGYDTILVSANTIANEELLGNSLANAVDRGSTVVLIMLTSCTTWKRPKGRFEGYWPMQLAAQEGSAGKSLGILFCSRVI